MSESECHPTATPAVFFDFLKAAKEGDLATLQTLVEKDPTLPTREVVQPFGSGLIAATAFKRLDCVRYLLPLCDPEAQDMAGRTALMVAAQQGDLECLNVLLPHCNANAESGQTRRNARPISQAIRGDHQACVQALLPYTDLTVSDAYGCTVLMHAVERPHTDSTELLLPFFDAAQREQALLHAAGAGSLANVLLLSQMCDPCAIDPCGCTALMYAASKGEDACVKALFPLSRPQMVDRQGKTALIHALGLPRNTQQYLHNDSLSLLLACGTQKDSNGVTPLLHAAHAHFVAGIRLLAPHSAVLACDATGYDAFGTLLLYYFRPRAAGIEPPLRGLDALVPYIDDFERLKTVLEQIKPQDRLHCPQLVAAVERTQLNQFLDRGAASPQTPTRGVELTPGVGEAPAGLRPRRI